MRFEIHIPISGVRILIKEVMKVDPDPEQLKELKARIEESLQVEYKN